MQVFVPSQRQSNHARRRREQRAIDDAAIESALAWGTSFQQRGGRTAWFLSDRDVAWAGRAGVDVLRHRHTTVVVGRDGGVITVFRTTNTRRLRRGAR